MRERYKNTGRNTTEKLTNIRSLLEALSRAMNLITNMYEDFNIRPVLLKSKQYYNNAFRTAVNYEDLMALKKVLKK